MKAGWTTALLAELCEFQRGLTYEKADEVENSRNVVLRANNIDLATGQLNLDELKFIGNSIEIPQSKRVRRNSLLVCTASGSKAHLGKVALIDRDYDYAFGGFMGQITPGERVLPAFLFYLMTSDGYRDFIASLADGANINNLKFTQLGRFQVPLPPLPEQRRIVAILDEAFEGIAKAEANAQKNIDNAKAVFESHLSEVFTKRGEGWVERRLDELCAITSTLVDPMDVEHRGLVHVGAANIAQDTGELIELKTAEEEKLISGKFRFDSSMVLYSKIRPYLRKVARPGFSGICSADIYPLMPRSRLLSRDFLFFMLLSHQFTEYAIQGSARAGMPKVNREHLFAFSSRVPCVERQVELTKTLDNCASRCQQLCRLYEQRQVALRDLKQSLLHHAFSGEL